MEEILALRANPPVYDETTLGKEFVERYGYTSPRYRFDEFDVYAVPEDDPTAEPVLVRGSEIELQPGEATPHSLTQEGVATIEDWCDFLQEKRYAVLNAGPLILDQKELNRWTRRMRKILPPKKFGRNKRKTLGGLFR